MAESELPEDVRQLIWSAVPSVDALELVVFLAGQAGRTWTPDALLHEFPRMKDAELREYLRVLQQQRLLEPAASGLTWRPATPALEAAVAGLCRAYQERPVTLIRTIYSIADSRKIQAFADAFKLKKDS